MAIVVSCFRLFLKPSFSCFAIARRNNAVELVADVGTYHAELIHDGAPGVVRGMYPRTTMDLWFMRRKEQAACTRKRESRRIPF